jgi:hypothetical protein
MSLLQTADMERILAELSDERPVFHSEADFQFALALKMQQLRTPRGQDDCWRRGASVGRAGGGRHEERAGGANHSARGLHLPLASVFQLPDPSACEAL